MRLRADRVQLELRVEGRNLQHPDERHFEHFGDVFDRRLGNPAILLLCPHQKRDHSRLLAAFRVFVDRLFGPGRVRP